jgi:RecB family exonuclease
MAKKGFDPQQLQPFKLSRSKIELFCQCPLCFYLDRKLGVTQPPGFPFNLNSAVDHLLKKEFDRYREKNEPHPLMIKHKIDAVPFQHEKLEDWRKNHKGISFLHESIRFLVYGAVDDVWINPQGELIIVDYKATSKSGEINIDADWQLSYKRQIETYQWLLRKNGFQVSSTGYFIYCNGRKDLPDFDECLKFEISVIPYLGDDSWIEPKLQEIYESLTSPTPPLAHTECDLCQYRTAAQTKLEAVLV